VSKTVHFVCLFVITVQLGTNAGKDLQIGFLKNINNHKYFRTQGLLSWPSVNSQVLPKFFIFILIFFLLFPFFRSDSGVSGGGISQVARGRGCGRSERGH
jgi:hypothetical protein